MNLKLDGKLALVTGSSSGIGYAIAESLAAEDARVIVNGRTQQRVDAALAKLKKSTGKDALGFAGDLATKEGADDVIRKFPDVEILINNLGIFEPKPFDQIPDEDWLRLFEVNVLSGVRLSRYYLPRMIAAGWGRVIFISSESGIQIPSEMIHYGMTKTAQLAVSRGMAELTAGTAVTVNSVLPGPTASEGVEEFVERLARDQSKTKEQVEKDFFADVRPTQLLKRFATTEEVAALVTFVASPLSSATNGAALRVDGGTVRSIV